MVVKDK